MSIRKIVSYNVNGIRAAVGKGLLDWLKKNDPDVVCIQETKAQPEQIPILELAEIGYKTYCFSAQKKGYSGVAILSKTEPDLVIAGMQIPAYDAEGRLIRADFGDLSILSIYHPSGSSTEERQAFKMKWLDDFSSYVEDLRKTRPRLLLAGDYNICHQAIDIHDPVRNANSSGFLPEERAWFDRFLSLGYTDSFRYFHPDQKDQYSWWSYRTNARARNLGWRIDYLLATNNLSEAIHSANIHPEAMHSDHCPVSINIEMNS